MQDASQRFDQLVGFLQLDPGNLQLLVDAMDAGLQAHRSAEVVRLAASQPQELKTEPAVEYKLAYCLLQLREFDQAKEICNRQLGTEGARSEWFYIRALANLMVQDFQSALDDFNLFTQGASADDPNIQFYRARCLYSLGRTEEALELLVQLPEPNNGQADVLSIWALAALDVNDAALASDKVRILENLGVQSWVVPYVKGQLLLEAQQAEQAEQQLLEARRLDPEQGRVWSSLAYAFMLGMKIQEAEVAFERAVELMPDHIGTWHGLGWLRLVKEDVMGAQWAFEAALTLDRNFGDSHGAMAIIHLLGGELTQAKESAERGRRLDKHSAASHFAHSLILDASGDHAKAQRMIKAIIQRSQAGSIIESVLPSLFGSGRKRKE